VRYSYHQILWFHTINTINTNTRVIIKIMSTEGVVAPPALIVKRSWFADFVITVTTIGLLGFIVLKLKQLEQRVNNAEDEIIGFNLQTNNPRPPSSTDRPHLLQGCIEYFTKNNQNNQNNQNSQNHQNDASVVDEYEFCDGNLDADECAINSSGYVEDLQIPNDSNNEKIKYDLPPTLPVTPATIADPAIPPVIPIIPPAIIPTTPPPPAIEDSDTLSQEGLPGDSV